MITPLNLCSTPTNEQRDKRDTVVIGMYINVVLDSNHAEDWAELKICESFLI